MTHTSTHTLARRLAACLLCLLITAQHAAGTEYFVSLAGSDEHPGTTPDQAFRTIQQGVDALSPGDTLTVAPGEYAERVTLSDFGDVDRPTTIRAAIRGTVLLRGDRDLELEWTRVPGQRFVYQVECEGPVLSVLESDTWTILSEVTNVRSVNFGAGRFFFDEQRKRLYVSATDLRSPAEHQYRASVRKGHGLELSNCRGVVIDGLAASGFMTPIEKKKLNFPTSGIMVRGSTQCVVRHCTAFFNRSGITLNSRRGEGENLVEFCHAYGNGEGMVGYDPNGETFRDSRAVMNRVYGARFYGRCQSDKLCLLTRMIAWGNPGGDYWFKGKGLSAETEHARAENSVAFETVHIRKFERSAAGELKRGAGRANVNLPDQREPFLEFVDRHFADPLNHDFRPQANATFVEPEQDGDQTGPHPFTDNIHYLSPDGSDSADGRSVQSAWRTLEHALASLEPGDTLYLSEGA